MMGIASSLMEMIVKHLLPQRKNLGNLEELEQLLIASCMAWTGVYSGRPFIWVHAIAHGVGVYGHVHPGTLCALVLPYALIGERGRPDPLQGSVKFLEPKSFAQARPKGDRSQCQRFSATCNRRSALRVARLWRLRGTADPWRNTQYIEGRISREFFRLSPKAEGSRVY